LNIDLLINGLLLLKIRASKFRPDTGCALRLAGMMRQWRNTL